MIDIEHVVVAAQVATGEVETGKVAVERNGEIVPRAQYGETVLAGGDSLEVVSFMGGG